MHNDSLAARRTWTSLGAETIQALEHRERTREEWQRRYGVDGMVEDVPKRDPIARANEILAKGD